MESFAVRRKNFVDDLLFDKDSVADYFHNSVQQADDDAQLTKDDMDSVTRSLCENVDTTLHITSTCF